MCIQFGWKMEFISYSLLMKILFSRLVLQVLNRLKQKCGYKMSCFTCHNCICPFTLFLKVSFCVDARFMCDNNTDMFKNDSIAFDGDN